MCFQRKNFQYSHACIARHREQTKVFAHQKCMNDASHNKQKTKANLSSHNVVFLLFVHISHLLITVFLFVQLCSSVSL